jgi:hypothetical protein
VLKHVGKKMCYQNYNNKLKVKCPCAYNKYFSILNISIIVCKKALSDNR